MNPAPDGMKAIRALFGIRGGLISFVVALFFAPGCVSEPGIDKARFTELHRSAQELKVKIASGEVCALQAGDIQELSSDLASINNRVSSRPERDLIAAYSNLLVIYKDGLVLCDTRNRSSEFQVVPKGRIYVSQHLDSLVDKYGFATQKHLYKPTGQFWRSIPEESIRVVWENAEAQTKAIENMLKYN